VKGNGKVFYFQPGHETYPIYYNENIQKILKNAVRWVCPVQKNMAIGCVCAEPLEK